MALKVSSAQRSVIGALERSHSGFKAARRQCWGCADLLRGPNTGNYTQYISDHVTLDDVTLTYIAVCVVCVLCSTFSPRRLLFLRPDPSKKAFAHICVPPMFRQPYPALCITR